MAYLAGNEPRIPVVLAVATSITRALHGGRTCRLTGTGSAFAQTLPAATGSGAKFRFEIGVVNTSNHVIQVANATDVMEGSILSCADGGDTTVGWETGATSDTVTLNGTTTGGSAVGDYVEVEDVAAGKWAVRGTTKSTGVEATPFSAAVS